jgi:hypothetical protein
MTDVLFQSDYWFASNYSQRVEVVQNFVETDEGIRSLVIIDFNGQNNLKEILNTLSEEDQIPCYVRLVIGNPESPLEIYEYNFSQGTCNKTIYLLRRLDNMATALIKRVKPILALFV